MVLLKEREITPLYIGIQSKRARDWLGITQQEAADYLGIRRETFAAKEKGENKGFLCHLPRKRTWSFTRQTNSNLW